MLRLAQGATLPQSESSPGHTRMDVITQCACVHLDPGGCGWVGTHMCCLVSNWIAWDRGCVLSPSGQIEVGKQGGEPQMGMRKW